MNTVPKYESSDEEHSIVSDRPLKKPRRRNRKRSWNIEQTFEDKATAIAFIENENNWSYHYSNNTSEGKKTYYRCNLAKRMGDQCDASIHLVYHNDSLNVTLYRTANNHTCGQSSPVGLSDEAKAEIARLNDLKVKPKKIYELLHKNDNTANHPKNQAQINNFLQRLRKKDGPTTISLGDLEEWCEQRNKVPEDIDEAFVVSYQVHHTDDDGEDQEVSFKLVISTIRLLQHCRNSNRLHADATYKVNWEGMPVLIAGVTDQNRRFHPVCLAVCSNERQSSFVGHLLPSSNNALESFNLVFKKEETLRERMPLGRFLNQCIVSANRWSDQYTMGKSIADRPTIDLDQWTEAYQWVKSKKNVPTKECRGYTEYYCPTDDQQTVSPTDIRRVLSRQWTSFDLFKERAFSVWVVRMNTKNWLDGRCTCKNYLKQYMCKHLLGLAIRLKLTTPPPAAKQIPIGQKRKRGRPSLAAMALIVN